LRRGDEDAGRRTRLDPLFDLHVTPAENSDAVDLR
jgi:hypothetical protein